MNKGREEEGEGGEKRERTPSIVSGEGRRKREKRERDSQYDGIERRGKRKEVKGKGSKEEVGSD